jgi:hypothetical protein
MPHAKTKKLKQHEPPPPSSTFRWFFGNIFKLIRKHGGTIAVCTLVAYCVHETSRTFIAYAGKTSMANLVFNLFAHLEAVWTLSLTMTGVSVMLYLRERKLHRKTRDRLTDRIAELELRIDPNRTSSLLTPEGLTRKEDE